MGFQDFSNNAQRLQNLCPSALPEGALSSSSVFQSQNEASDDQ